MTPEEISQLVECARLLKTKLDQYPSPLAQELWLKQAYDGAMQVLKHTLVDVS